MNAEQALHSFWSSFDLPAYDETTIPTGKNLPSLPYITYNVSLNDFGIETAMDASVWYRSPTWSEASAKVEQIAKRITMGGIAIHCDGGILWIKKGNPFANRLADESDNTIRRYALNIVVEFLKKGD